TFVAMNDPREPLVTPAREAVPRVLNFATLMDGATRLKSATARFETAYAAVFTEDGPSLDPSTLDSLNALLRAAAHAMALPEGLPRRPWYRQLLAAPGRETGYAPKTLPGVREAIEATRSDEAEVQAAVLARALGREGEALDQASVLLEHARGTQGAP